MSVSLSEVIEGAGYDLKDLDDIQRVKQMLLEAEDLYEELEAYEDQIAHSKEYAEEALADWYIHEPDGSW